MALPDLPQAGRFREVPDFPFCSERCRLLDLGNWASEKYKISEPVFDESELPTLPDQDPDDRKN